MYDIPRHGGSDGAASPRPAIDLAKVGHSKSPAQYRKNLFDCPTEICERVVDLADVFGYGPSAPGWLEPARSRVLP